MKIVVQIGSINTDIDQLDKVYEHEFDSRRGIARVSIEGSGITTGLVGNNKAVSVMHDGGENFNIVKLSANGDSLCGQRFGVMVKALKSIGLIDSCDTIESAKVYSLLKAISNNDMSALLLALEEIEEDL